MNKKLLLLTIALICMLVMLAACGGNTATDDTGANTDQTGTTDSSDFHIEISLADHLSADHPYMKYASVKYMELVTERTDGRVTFKHYPSTQAGAMKDQINMMQTGIVDMANSPAAIFSEQLPLSNVVNLPGWGLSPDKLALAFYDIATDENSSVYKNDFEKNGIRMLFCGCFPFYQLQSNKAVQGADDFANLIVRSPGGSMDLILQSLGASVVTVAPTELYEAMQRGTVDAMYSPQESLIPQALNEVMKYSTGNLDLNSFIMMWDISEATWETIPADIQQIMIDCGKEVTESFSLELQNVWNEAQTQLEAQGIEYYNFTDDQLAELHEKIAGVPEEWKNAVDAKGLSGTQTYNDFAAVVETYK